MKHWSFSLCMGSLLLSLLIFISIFAPLLAPYNPYLPDMAHRLASPSLTHWLGTDALGRDILSRLLYGGRVTLRIAFLSSTIALGLGLFAGIMAGYIGGFVDEIITMMTQIFLSVPSICLMVTIAGLFGGGENSLLLGTVLVSWASLSRIIRMEALRFRKASFVEGLYAMGAGNLRILFIHILPHLGKTLFTLGALRMGRIALAISGLSFLGLGVRPPTPDWSVMIADAMTYWRGYPHLVLSPGIAILMLVLSLQLIAQGLSKGSEQNI